MSSVKRKSSSSGAAVQKRRMVDLMLAPATEAGEESPVTFPSRYTHALLWLKDDIAGVLPTNLVPSLQASVVRSLIKISLYLDSGQLIMFPDVKRMGSQDEVAFRNDDVYHSCDIPIGY
jgi:hypothetical protein